MGTEGGWESWLGDVLGVPGELPRLRVEWEKLPDLRDGQGSTTKGQGGSRGRNGNG